MAETFQEKLNELQLNIHQLKLNKWTIKYFFKWCIDWRTKKSVEIPGWLTRQVNEENELDDVVKFMGWKDLKNPVDKCITISEWMSANLKYLGDMTKWNIAELWQEALLTFQLMTGDCEDGTILWYVLCRKAEVPHYMILLNVGHVDDGRGNKGGHCWGSFSVDIFDHFADWCYYKNKYLKIPPVIGRSEYKEIWWRANEEYTYGELRKI